VTVQKRSLKVEKLARIYDDEIAPVWGTRFGRMLLRNLAVPDRGQVLDVSCGTGYPLTEILRRLGEGSRVIAIDASSAMLDVARKKIADLGPGSQKRVFFRTESALPKLSFTDDVYDLVVCNLGLTEMPDVHAAMRDFARVTKQGGEVRCTLPLAGSFQEFHDIYREVLVKHDKHDVLARLDEYLARYPTPEQCTSWMAAAGLDGHVEVETYTLLFRSSREFFFAPVIEYGPLADWKAIAGNGQELQDVFWYIKEAIDAYFGGRAFEVTIVAGCLVGSKRAPAPVVLASAPALPLPPIDTLDAPRDHLDDDLDRDFADDLDDFADELATGRVELVDPDDPDLVELPPPVDLAVGSVRTSDTSEIDLVEIEEMTSTDYAPSGSDDVGLDAFVEGAQRPDHLEE
jgi:ubiquinone/menaquinone biosynthesis C-methylase UbiE